MIADDWSGLAVIKSVLLINIGFPGPANTNRAESRRIAQNHTESRRIAQSKSVDTTLQVPVDLEGAVARALALSSLPATLLSIFLHTMRVPSVIWAHSHYALLLAALLACFKFPLSLSAPHPGPHSERDFPTKCSQGPGQERGPLNKL